MGSTKLISKTQMETTLETLQNPKKSQLSGVTMQGAASGRRHPHHVCAIRTTI